jgi:hypothetical protein
MCYQCAGKKRPAKKKRPKENVEHSNKKVRKRPRYTFSQILLLLPQGRNYCHQGQTFTCQGLFYIVLIFYLPV